MASELTGTNRPTQNNPPTPQPNQTRNRDKGKQKKRGGQTRKQQPPHPLYGPQPTHTQTNKPATTTPPHNGGTHNRITQPPHHPPTPHTKKRGHRGEQAPPPSRWSQQQGTRPDPSRTRKLSPPAPMVLHPPGCGRVGHHRAHTTPGPLGTRPTQAGRTPRGPDTYTPHPNTDRPTAGSAGRLGPARVPVLKEASWPITIIPTAVTAGGMPDDPNGMALAVAVITAVGATAVESETIASSASGARPTGPAVGAAMVSSDASASPGAVMRMAGPWSSADGAMARGAGGARRTPPVAVAEATGATGATTAAADLSGPTVPPDGLPSVSASLSRRSPRASSPPILTAAPALSSGPWGAPMRRTSPAT